MPEAEALPPSHPLFASHFTKRLYDAEDFSNDDVAPFGTDEGWDAVREWADRVDDLVANPTLRYMIGQDADAFIAELKADPQTDVDDVVIGQGFTLLRVTGQIDAEGRAWLTEALQRQADDRPGGEYDTMLDDLSTFGRQTACADPKIKSGRTAERQPAGWLTLSGGWNDPPHAKWLGGIARAVMADDEWSQWWAAADVDTLTLAPRPGGRGDTLHFERRTRHLDVSGASTVLTRRLEELVLEINRMPEGMPLHEVAEDVPSLFST